MKNIFRVLIFLVVFLFQVNSSFAATFKNKAKYENFPDVIGTKYEDAALYLKAFKYISGYPDGTFRPDSDITRAELLKIALGFSAEAHMGDFGDISKLDTFSDVPKEHWAKQDIELAAKIGIVSGYEDGTFRPNNKVTYSEVLTILLNVHGLKNKVNAIDESWPLNYILYSYDNEITPHLTDVNLYSNPATRGEVALIISNIRGVEWEE